jgi:3'-phosphoadenosine 5'-phosphosulfate (PAPS) 3'-phosphatase
MKTKEEILEKHCPSMNNLYLDNQGRNFRDRILKAMEQYASQPKGEQLFRWVDTRVRQPKEEKYYTVLRGEGNATHPTGCYVATHFWHQSEQLWSSQTKYWLEEI